MTNTTTSGDTRRTSRYERPMPSGRGPIDWLGGWRWAFIALILVLGSAIALRIYQGFVTWPNGYDSSSHNFKIYYTGLLYAELIGIGLITVIWWGWLAATGKRLPKKVTIREEVYRIAIFWGLVGATSASLYVEASFFPNEDGAWHQTLVRDTAFTPSHIPMFYFFFPLSIVLAIGTYLYGRTRLPQVYGAIKGFPWSFFLLISAAVTEMIQVALNEWGHSIAYPEEFFSVWFHWPFVAYGWLASGIFALWGETITRLYKLEDHHKADPEQLEDAAQTGNLYAGLSA